MFLFYLFEVKHKFFLGRMTVDRPKWVWACAT